MMGKTIDYQAVHRAATDQTGDDPVLMACALVLAGRWPDPQAVAGVLIHDDPRTVVQVVLNALIGATHRASAQPTDDRTPGTFMETHGNPALQTEPEWTPSLGLARLRGRFHGNTDGPS